MMDRWIDVLDRWVDRFKGIHRDFASWLRIFA